MKKIVASEFQKGRRFVGRLPHNKDIIKSTESFCINNSIHMASFSIIGAVSSAAIGFYDQKKKRYDIFEKKLHFLRLLKDKYHYFQKKGSLQ